MLCLSSITCDPFRQLFHPFLPIAFYSLLFASELLHLRNLSEPLSGCSVIHVYKIHFLIPYISIFLFLLILLQGNEYVHTRTPSPFRSVAQGTLPKKETSNRDLNLSHSISRSKIRCSNSEMHERPLILQNHRLLPRKSDNGRT